MRTAAFLLMLATVLAWWQWQFGIGWTIRAVRRYRHPPSSPQNPFARAAVRNNPRDPYLPSASIEVPEPDDERDHADAVSQTRH